DRLDTSLGDVWLGANITTAAVVILGLLLNVVVRKGATFFHWVSPALSKGTISATWPPMSLSTRDAHPSLALRFSHETDRASYISSTTIATALPPPRHSDASPRFRPRCSRADSSVTSTRVPEAPIGCPRAIAPPWTFTLPSSSFSSLPHASICAANASFSSNR